MASSAAKRYAQAIFSLGQEQGTLDTWGQDLAMLSGVVADQRIATYHAERNATSLDGLPGLGVPAAR